MGIIDRFEYKGVEGIRVGRFNIGFNTTTVFYRVNHTLIDTGPPNQWGVMRGVIEEKPLRQVILTHHHEDHSGNAANLSRDFSVEVFAPAGSIDPMVNGFALRMYQKLLWGRPGKMKPLPVPEKIAAGQGIGLIPVGTPGHSPDMTCFFEPERKWLFSGDLFISRSLFYLRQDEDFGMLIRSLKQILTFDFQTVFCAHRGIVQNGRQALREKLDFLVSLARKARKLHSAGLSVSLITRRLLGREDHMSLFTTYHFSKQKLIRSCLKLDERLID